MRKTALILAVIMLLTTIAVPVLAAEPRATTIIPEITISGYTAECYVQCVGNYTTDELEATIKLWIGSVCVDTWYAEGNGYIFFEKTRTITPGYTYTLTVDLTINGKSCPRASASDS